MTEPVKPIGRGLPCVVQIGFAGSRRLWDAEPKSAQDRRAFEQDILQELVQVLQGFAGQTGLSQPHFLCGISQVAIGGDTLFTRACRELNIPQRVFLPQRRHEYLNAVGSDGTPDFSDAQRGEAEELLSSGHIIEERVVSAARDRTTRFEDTNLEILRASDVILCLLPAETEDRPGGTGDLMEKAAERHKTAIEIRVLHKAGETTFKETWHHRDEFQVPRLPPALSSLASGEITSIEDYSDRLKQFASGKANWLRRFFHVAAFAIIGTHILATILATLALAGHSGEVYGPWIAWLLFAELALLATGLTLHWYLHHSHAVKEWAFSRLLAEIARSMRAISNLHLYPDYLFALQFPERLRPLLQTLSILHLRSTRTHRNDPWQPQRDHYVRLRLRDKESGQIRYYTNAHAAAGRWFKWTPRAFFLSSLLAVGATAIKFLIVTGTAVLPGEAFPWAEVLGTLAIVLPVFAVGFLSVAASMDVEARVHTYGEMLDFLEKQTRQLDQAASERDFLRLLLETESRLLGETATWFSRRSFTGVT